MKTRALSVPLALLTLLSFSLRADAQVIVSAPGVPVTQDFDTLASAGTSSVVPLGWVFAESGSNANATYTAGTGSGNAGDTYSFGAAGSTDRALGGLLSGSLTPTLGAWFVNDTGGAITQLDIVYAAEQWRLGTAGRVDRLDFQYSLDATSLTTGTWVDVDVLDAVAPVTGPTTGALDGNVNRVGVTGQIANLSIPDGASFWIRWSDFNASGADDGIGIDDFTLTATVSVVPVPTNPTGIGLATPAQALPGATTLLTVAVTPGTNPPSSGVGVTADLSALGGAAAQALADDGTGGDATAGDGVYSFVATVGTAAAAGAVSLPVIVSDAEGRTSTTAIAFVVLAPPIPGAVVISQVYGGGGNSGATFRNDFIELYNRGGTPVDLTNWSVQYASSSGSSWQRTLLAGVIEPGRYYLVQEAAGSGGTTDLPTPDATGTLAMSGTSGKVALVNADALLSGTCPAGATIVDLVGYGSASCSETAPTPALSNTTAALRRGGGAQDTNDNSADFEVGAPNPRSSRGIPPRGTGLATPASAPPTETTLLTVAVVPGSQPASTTVSVTADLTPIGGAASQPLLDDGALGDAAAGDGVYSYLATVGNVAGGAASIVATVADDLGRASTASIAFNVEAPPTAIHDIQGPGGVSPLRDTTVTTRGIVTAVKFNGAFIQSPPAETDSLAETSEGIFVFTSTTPSVQVGDLVRVTGTVSEFVPSADPLSPPLTELTSATFVLLASGVPVPPPVVLTAADTDPAGALDQLERYEGMRVSVPALRVVAPTDGSVSEANGTATSNGVFYAVIDGVARPFREPGIDALSPVPPGLCCVPIFDTNPERLRVDSDALVGSPAIEVTSGALVTNIVGPLDFSFRTYTILPEAQPGPTVSGNAVAAPVPAPDANEFTVASYNLERFFDDVDAPGIGDVVLTAAAFQGRLAKASLAIREVMRTPDVLGVVEVEDLATLQALAARLNADAVAAGDPDPGYVAYLVEGNDIGGIDVGFLVKETRVAVTSVTQVGAAATYVEPGGAVALLNDRPPLVLRARIAPVAGEPFPVTVVVNHLRSLNGIDGTDGERIRAKRLAQAEFLAVLLQQLQAGGERVVSVGDYNAFEFSDGYVDVIGSAIGRPAAPGTAVLTGNDLVDPDYANLVEQVPAEQRYSYSFDGSAQVLDHVLASERMMTRFNRIHFARSNADFPESLRGDTTRPERLSDHDMPVAYFVLPGAPTLTLMGPNPMQVERCASFTDPGATAADVEAGDLTSQIVVTGAVDTLVVGSYALVYSVSNGFQTTTVTRIVEVVDTTPPVITLLGDNPMTVEAGTAFVDPGATAADSCTGDLSGAITVSGGVNTSVPGSYPVVYEVTDGYNTVSVTRIVDVVDRTAPVVGHAVASPGLLWPPNHKLVDVSVLYSATDAVTATPACSLTVTSDERVNGICDGNTSPDWVVVDADTVRLRAERSCLGNGRVYTIAIACTDAAGNTGHGKARVFVPLFWFPWWH